MSSSTKSRLLIRLGIWLLLCPVLFPALAYVACQYMPRKYTSRNIIELKPDNFGIRIFRSDLTDPPIFVEDEIAIIQSKEILYPVIDQLGLSGKWLNGQTGEQAKTIAYGKLRKMLRLSSLRNTDMLEIQVTSTDPREAADIANAIAILYQKRRLEEKTKFTTQTLSKSADEIEKLRKNVDEASAEVSRIRIRDQILDTNPDSLQPADKAHPEYEAAKRKYHEAKQLLDDAEQRLQTLRLEIKISMHPAEIWENAEPSKEPSSPNIPRILLLAFCAGLLPAIPGAFLVYVGLQSKP